MQNLRHYQNLVLPVGIEPTSMVLQTTAMTTSAKAAKTGENDGNRTHAKRITISDATITSQTPY